MKHTESYIDNTIETPENIPKNIKALLQELHKWDESGQEGADVFYYDRLDDLWVNAKNAVAAGVMSKKDWKTIEQKYWIHADIVMQKEDNNENIRT
ncbi:MAG: hypothetical protein K5751_07880 [Treponemataceae bacterium]|nr:hypothetical protein [Treponemataceae bacterium]